MLRGFGRLDAIEVDGEARALASRRLGHAVSAAPLPELRGIPDGTYHLIALLDVLEHVDRRPESLASIAAKLAPGGRILVTVPAYQWMWSAHDVAHHHKLRYSKRACGATPRRRALACGRSAISTACSSRSRPRCGSPARRWARSSSDDKIPPGAAQPPVHRHLRARASPGRQGPAPRRRVAVRIALDPVEHARPVPPDRRAGPAVELGIDRPGRRDQPDIIERVAREVGQRPIGRPPDLAGGSGRRVTIWVGSRMNGQPGL